MVQMWTKTGQGKRQMMRWKIKKEGKQDEKVENICLAWRKVSDKGKRKEIIEK